MRRSAVVILVGALVLASCSGGSGRKKAWESGGPWDGGAGIWDSGGPWDGGAGTVPPGTWPQAGGWRVG